MAEYATTRDEITAILDQLRGLLGEGTPVTAPLPSTIPDDIGRRLDALPNGLGETITALIQSRKSQAEISAELATIDPSLVPVVEESATNVEAGRTDIDNTTSQYSAQDDALQPVENTPLGAMASLQNKANALNNGSEAVRNQMPPAELRRVLVDALAQKYYDQAQAAMSGSNSSGNNSGGNPLSALGQMGQMGGNNNSGGSPLSNGLSSSLGDIASFATPQVGNEQDMGADPTSMSLTGALPPGVANEYGLQRNSILAARAISAAFPEISDIGGYRQDSLHWHPDGLAIDVMVPNYRSADGVDLGNRILAFTQQYGQRFGIDHIIWRQTMYIPGQQPRLMTTRGDENQDHYNHLHIATDGGGYPTGNENYVL